MPQTPTALSVKPMNRAGELYQRRAFEVLPILVRQTATGVPLTYGQVATEVGMPNRRNLNHVLGSIGVTLQLLSKEWARRIPPIQSLVINQDTRIPGDGFDDFFEDPSIYRNAPIAQKRKVIETLWKAVTAYPDWHRVLRHLEIAPLPALPLDTLMDQSARARFGNGGEGEEHRDFKLFVSRNPHLVKVWHKRLAVETEFRFASADAVDVLFASAKTQTAVEVKARNAPPLDVLRGIFQCVKYEALMRATHAVKGQQLTSRVVLALEGPLPPEWCSVAKMLGIEVIDNIRPK